MTDSQETTDPRDAEIDRLRAEVARLRADAAMLTAALQGVLDAEGLGLSDRYLASHAASRTLAAIETPPSARINGGNMSDSKTTDWRPVETAPPHAMFIGWDEEDGQPCLAFSHAGKVYWAHCIIADDAAAHGITHWQPLPAKSP